MAQLNQEIRHSFQVTNGAAAVTGLAQGAFAITLRRRSAATYVAASEPLTVQEIDAIGLPGLYWIFYTPTADTTLYRLTVTHATYTVSQGTFEDQVESGYAAASGTYLTSRANVQAAFPALAKSEFNPIIDQLLGQVTDDVHAFCRRRFNQATDTFLTEAAGWAASTLQLPRYPVQSIASVHVCLDLPRVWDASTLLDPTTDYTVDLSAGLLMRNDGSYWPFGESYGLGCVRVVVAGGPSVVPGHIERAVIEIIAVKAMKSRDNQYHLTSVQIPEIGAIQGIKWDDWPPHAREVLERERV